MGIEDMERTRQAKPLIVRWLRRTVLTDRRMTALNKYLIEQTNIIDNLRSNMELDKALQLCKQVSTHLSLHPQFNPVTLQINTYLHFLNVSAAVYLCIGDFDSTSRLVSAFDRVANGNIIDNLIIYSHLNIVVELHIKLSSYGIPMKIVDRILPSITEPYWRGLFLLKKGFVEIHQSPNVFTINSLCEALKEANASGDNSLIAQVYIGLAR
ncbi:MAG: hypothetical protein LBM20_05450, partial [Rikenellaceae bacterium]|nr:hypothetical protein [Rikenellaceae bacterium]